MGHFHNRIEMIRNCNSTFFSSNCGKSLPPVSSSVATIDNSFFSVYEREGFSKNVLCKAKSPLVLPLAALRNRRQKISLSPQQVSSRHLEPDTGQHELGFCLTTLSSCTATCPILLDVFTSLSLHKDWARPVFPRIISREGLPSFILGFLVFVTLRNMSRYSFGEV